jgi:serine protease Do
LVKDVVPHSPADLGRVLPGDVILRFDQTVVEDDTHLVNLVKLTPVGKRVPVEVYRGGNRVLLDVEVADRRSFENK